MERIARHAWLYVRDGASVHIARMDLTLTVYGPGPAEHQHLFRDNASLDEFLRWYGEALDREGWVLQAYIDRRAAPREASAAPGGVERRRRSGDRADRLSPSTDNP
jgi:hypothetical protein